MVDGPTTGRRLAVEAPLEVRGSARADGGAVRRFRLLLGGPAPATAAVAIPAGAGFTLVVTPERRLPELERIPADATGGELLLLAQAALLRLARVHQFDMFVSPTAGEGFSPTDAEASAVYRYRTSPAPRPRPSSTSRTTAPAWGSSSCSQAARSCCSAVGRCVGAPVI